MRLIEIIYYFDLYPSRVKPKFSSYVPGDNQSKRRMPLGYLINVYGKMALPINFHGLQIERNFVEICLIGQGPKKIWAFLMKFCNKIWTIGSEFILNRKIGILTHMHKTFKNDLT